MVRIEKIVYEKAFNTSALGRSRNLTTPMKWFTTNPYEHAASTYSSTQSSPIRISIPPGWENSPSPSSELGSTTIDPTRETCSCSRVWYNSHNADLRGQAPP